AYTLTASPSPVSPGAPIQVNWTAPAGHSTLDWVGLYRVGAPDNSYIAYQYADSSTSGQMTFIAPSEEGQYEFRMFVNDGWTRAATSNPVTVSP
ncbi:MAG TPA: hypothetical protein VGV38_18475, partial [Pyrinomonadaceae bacterium]|nr:hypothetical protein [Pyrinomonadaceae bacterium]